MSQVSMKSVSLRSVMRTAAFVRGYKESLTGVPLDYKAYEDEYTTDNRWSYERGRLFGTMYKGQLKFGRTLSYEAIEAFNDAVGQRAII